MTCILTFSGKQFDLQNPTPDMVCIEDIAYALSGIPRFNAHANQVEAMKPDFLVRAKSQQLGDLYDATFTVAHHSILVANLLPEEHKLDGLVHDAAKAYIGEITPSVKHLTGARYELESMENRIHAAVAEKFGLCKLLATYDAVKHAKRVALATERFLFMPDHPEEWSCIAGVAPTHWDNMPLSTTSTSRRDVLTEFLNLFASVVRV